VARLEGLISRQLQGAALEWLHDEPVLALQGARSVGKSTLLRALAATLSATVIDLDDPETRQAVASDPAFFVRGPSPVCIDEYQHVPEVLDVIKAELNRDTRPGRFILTGSTRYDALPRATQSLTGRIHVVTIRPLSQAEITGAADGLVSALLADPAQALTARESTTTREDYIERIAAGGFPLALTRPPRRRQAWFDNYVTASLQRDILDLARIRQADSLTRLLERLAAQTAQLLNISHAAQAAGIEVRTANGYEKLLEALFLVHRLPAWGRTASSRAGRLPKLHVIDSGIAAYLQRVTPEQLARQSPAAMTQFGHLLETFVVNEILAQSSWTEDDPSAGHWRTRDGQEVDLVLESRDGRLTCFEVKAGTRIRAEDLRGLRALRSLVGEDFAAGIVLYTGRYTYQTDDGLYCAPIDRLWTTDPRTP